MFYDFRLSCKNTSHNLIIVKFMSCIISMFSQRSVNTLYVSHSAWLPLMTNSFLLFKATAFFIFTVTSSAMILSVYYRISFCIPFCNVPVLSGLSMREPQENESRKLSEAGLTLKHLPTCHYGIELVWSKTSVFPQSSLSLLAVSARWIRGPHNPLWA